jgi:hypothetical protein
MLQPNGHFAIFKKVLGWFVSKGAATARCVNLFSFLRWHWLFYHEMSFP